MFKYLSMDDYESDCSEVTWDAVYCPYFTGQIVTGKESIAKLTEGLKYFIYKLCISEKNSCKNTYAYTFLSGRLQDTI